MSDRYDYSVLRKEKNFGRRIAAQAVSRFGDSIDQIVFSWLMYQVTGNASMLALILFFNFLPNIAFQPFTGVLVERFSKKKVLVVCDVGRAAVVCLTIALYLAGMLNVPLLILITLLVSTLESFKLPASSAVLPYILPREKFDAGIALNSTVTRAFELIGRGAAGFFIALCGIPVSLGIDAVAFLFSAGANLALHFEEEAPAERLTARLYFSQFTDGLRLLGKLKNVLVLIIACSLLNFMMSPSNSYESAYAADSLRFGPEALSAMGVAVSLGITLGSFLSPKLHKYWSGRKLLFPFGVLLAAANAGLWLLPAVGSGAWRMALLIVDQFLFGLSVGVPSVQFSTRIMAAIPPDYLARVQGVSGAVQFLMIPLGALLCSGLALALPVPAVFLLFAGFILLAFVGSLFVKTFDEL